MNHSNEFLLWLIVLPLLLLLSFAVHAETLRCKTELKRLCDSAQVCTKTSNIHPAVEYVVDLRNEANTARISKLVGGKIVSRWKAELTPGDDRARHNYAEIKGGSNMFSLSKSFNTFSYHFTDLVGKASWEQNEVGICSTAE